MPDAHPLEAWRREKQLTLGQLGALLGTTAEAAGRYCRGRIPRPAIVARVFEVTAGAVEPNHFYGFGGAADKPNGGGGS